MRGSNNTNGGRLTRLLGMLAICGTLAVAGCGDDEASDTATGPQASSGASETTADETTTADSGSSTDTALPRTPPAEIRMQEALPSKPPAGKTVAMVLQDGPFYKVNGDEMDKAAAALGWKTKRFVSAPDKLSQTIVQAVLTKPDFIYLVGLSKPTLKAGLAAAAKAQIPVVNSGGGFAPSDPENYWYQLIKDESDKIQMLLDYMIEDSGGKAKIVNVNLTEVPGFVKNEKFSKAYVEDKSKCPDCTWDELAVSFADAGEGKIPNKIVSYLQTHPDVKYVYLAYGGISTGVVPALKSVGLLDRVRIVGDTPDKEALSRIADGSMAGWVMTPAAVAWQGADVLARLSVDAVTPELLDSPAVANILADPWILDDPAKAKELADLPFGWMAPEGYEDQYKALWKVS